MTTQRTTTCQGVPQVYESPCEIPGPHGPHGPMAAAIEKVASRSARIAAIHALADWYAQNPDQPMPVHITASTYTYAHHGPEVERVMAVLDFATRAGVDAEETWESVKARFHLFDQDGMNIYITMSATLEPSSAHRYVS
jgi:hypothetical protein